MARHESNFGVDSQEPLSLDDLLALLDAGNAGDSAARQDAIACYLSGGEGWREAVRLLGGTFAGEAAGLKERKAD